MAYRVRVVPKKRRRGMQQGKTTRKPHGLQVIESCLTWPLVKERIFCDLPKSVLAELDEISSPSTYLRDAVLFVEGQEHRGVFVICNGRVKLVGWLASGSGSRVGAGASVSIEGGRGTAFNFLPSLDEVPPGNRYIYFWHSGAIVYPNLDIQDSPACVISRRAVVFFLPGDS